eukprot:scaffold965_cov158-Amphora_coffeaeformis.AAC.1
MLPSPSLPPRHDMMASIFGDMAWFILSLTIVPLSLMVPVAYRRLSSSLHILTKSCITKAHKGMSCWSLGSGERNVRGGGYFP